MSSTLAHKTSPIATRPRRTQEQRREATRRQLLDAAIDCVNELGFNGALLSVIAERAGVTRGSVQYHFGHKNELFLALTEEIGEQLLVDADTDRLRALPLRERIAAVCEQHWQVINSRHFIAAIQIQLGTVHEPELRGRLYDAMRKAEAKTDRQWVELFGDRGVQANCIVAARHVALAAMRGLATRQIYQKLPKRWEEERLLLREMLEQILAPEG